MRRILLGIGLGLPLAAASRPGRYIVEFQEPPGAGPAMDGRERRMWARSAVARSHTAHSPLFDRIRNLGGRSFGCTHLTTDIISVEWGGDPGALLRLPGVAHVVPVAEFGPALDRALPLQQVPQALRLFGDESAGLGVLLGIVDSASMSLTPACRIQASPCPPAFPW